MRWLAVVLAAAAAAGCLRDPTACDDGRLCPAGTVCHAGGCATQEQIDACAGVASEAACTTSQIGLGVCLGGACVAQTCGNAHLDPAESCEGTMLRETTCAAIFAGYHGELACTDSCTYDTSTCTGSCGDGIVESPETCDGPIADPSCLAEDRDYGLIECVGCVASYTGCHSLGWSRELSIDARTVAAVGPETLVVADGNALHLLDLATGTLVAIATSDFLAQGVAVTPTGTIVIPGVRVLCTTICTTESVTWVGTVDGPGTLYADTGADTSAPVAVGADIYATDTSGQIHRWVVDHWQPDPIVDPVVGIARGPIAGDGTSLFATVPGPGPSYRLVRRIGPSALEVVGTVPNAHLLAALPGGDLVAGTNQGQSWRVSGGVTTSLDFGRDAIMIVTAIRATPDGRALAATAVGTAMLEGPRWSYLDEGAVTYDVTTTVDGSIFAGRPNGLLRLRPGRWQKLGHADQGSISVDLPWPTQPAYLVGGAPSVILVPGRIAAPTDGPIACTTPVARYFYRGDRYTRCVDSTCLSNAVFSNAEIACDPVRDRFYYSPQGTLFVVDDGNTSSVVTGLRPSSISVVPGAGALIAGSGSGDTGLVERFVDGAAMTEAVPGPLDAQGQPVTDPFTAIHACTFDDWFVATRGYVYRKTGTASTEWKLPENETIARIVASPDCSVVYAQSQQTLFRYTTVDPRWIPIRAPSTDAMLGIVYTDEGPIVSGPDGVSLLVLED